MTLDYVRSLITRWLPRSLDSNSLDSDDSSSNDELPFEAIDANESVSPAFPHAWCDAAGQPELKLLLVVTTCQRTVSVTELLGDLFSSATLAFGADSRSFSLLVIEDATETDYAQVRRFARDRFGDRLQWLRSTRRMGKRGYWGTYQAALRVAELRNPAQVMFVQDDIKMGADAIFAALRLFQELKDKDNTRGQAQVLNLFASDDDEAKGRWIRFSRRNVPGLPARQTQWFDLNAYLIERKALQELKYRMIPVPDSRWRFDSKLSSGVGQQLTKRLQKRGVTYQCFPPLAFHGSEDSVMNPEARTLRSLDNRHLQTLTVTADQSIASVERPKNVSEHQTKQR